MSAPTTIDGAMMTDEQIDAAITACALMIKGICLTKQRDAWTPLIEARIRFMLDSNDFRRAPTAEPAAPAQSGEPVVPANVMAALDRMCTPLDESVLKGVTAEADAHSMKLIRDYVLSTILAPSAAALDDGQEKPKADEDKECTHEFESFKPGLVICGKCWRVQPADTDDSACTENLQATATQPAQTERALTDDARERYGAALLQISKYAKHSSETAAEMSRIAHKVLYKAAAHPASGADHE
jgi:hypothetical protein